MACSEAASHRSVHLSVRFNPRELERVRLAARERGLSTSTFVRSASLGESLPAPRSHQVEHDAAALLVQAVPVLQGLLGRLRAEGCLEVAGELEGGLGLIQEALGRLTS